MTHEELRGRIVAYLATNPVLIDTTIRATDVVQWTEDKSLYSYLGEMQNISVWGGGIEIKAFCDLYRVNVIVHVKNTRRYVEFKGRSKTNGTIHIHWNGDHYEPIKLVRSINDIFV